MQLKKIHTITGEIFLLSGLHIGAGNDTIEIGGLDQPIIKHPITGAPYIPGSSIKGKMRSLLEVAYWGERPSSNAFIFKKGKPCNCGELDCPACNIFGNSNRESNTGPTRILVRDANLSASDQEKFERGELPMEVKYENIINRVSGVADHPRPLERVPAGVSFTFTITYKEFADDPQEFLDYIFKGMKLIELDAIGGNSSRGCGQIQFKNVTLDGEPIDLAPVTV
jgi:CRISPR-associated protein Csm3